jgi:hypothetical protein
VASGKEIRALIEAKADCYPPGVTLDWALTLTGRGHRQRMINALKKARRQTVQTRRSINAALEAFGE